jgi:prepilin-type N-terminal cleavage/methylation domain-containing protein
MSLTKQRQSFAGFTLLELLVSSALLGIVMMALLASASTGLSLWRNTEQRVSVDREGRTAMHVLSEDLAGIINPSSAALQPRFDTNRDAATPMAFLTVRPRDYQADPDKADFGDVCYVQYRFTSNALSRASVDSAKAFAELRNNELPTNNLSFEVLATNVLQFRVWAWDAEGRPVDGADTRVVDYLMEVVDAKGMDNFRRNPDLPLVGQQYFSGRGAVPLPR